jgi:hypothetical protein
MTCREITCDTMPLVVGNPRASRRIALSTYYLLARSSLIAPVARISRPRGEPFITACAAIESKAACQCIERKPRCVVPTHVPEPDGHQARHHFLLPRITPRRRRIQLHQHQHLKDNHEDRQDVIRIGRRQIVQPKPLPSAGQPPCAACRRRQIAAAFESTAARIRQTY